MPPPDDDDVESLAAASILVRFLGVLLANTQSIVAGSPSTRRKNDYLMYKRYRR